MNIILVEDVEDLREELAYKLGQDGHEVHGVGNSMELDRLLDLVKSQLILLDIGLPGEDGLAICHRLQKVPDLHIAMLTARSSDKDRREGLLSGADSYLVKPVDYEELDALIRRVEMRRRFASSAADGWMLSTRQQLLRAPDGCRISLTHAETLLLRTLVQRSDRTASRLELMNALGYGNVLDDRRIEVGMSRLRTKIKLRCGRELPVKSNRAMGYSFLEDCGLTE